MFRFLINKRRQKLLESPIPAHWRGILEQEVRYFRQLPPELQDALQRKMMIFVAEKYFEGCNGFDLTEPVQLAISAYAALLLLNRETDYYPGLKAILVYPEAFVASREIEDDDGMVWETEEVEEGESWTTGTVVLSWKDVLRDKRRFDGRNVIIHEFAHQLYDSGELLVDDPAARKAWVDTFDRHYEKHVEAVERGKRTFLDDYGAEDEAEFFSVVSEAFFEQPHKFRQRHPELYGVLQACYSQDPANYFDAPDPKRKK